MKCNKECCNPEPPQGEQESRLTVQSMPIRVMLAAPPGPGRSRHVSIRDLERFIERAKEEAQKVASMDKLRRGPNNYYDWLELRNVALQDSQLYVDTPWGGEQ